jgi:DNA-binding response OmpR family regulator
MTSVCRILNVDDHNDSREMVNFLLHSSDLNCEITSAECAETAISKMTNQSFDLYILDYSLPRASGVELCSYIRNNDSSAPILFFTAMARSIDREAGINAGADEYLVKPNDLDKLTETVKRLLNEKSSCLSNASIKNIDYNGIY